MQALFFDHIDAAAQSFFQIGDEPAWEERGCLRPGFDQKVQILWGLASPARMSRTP